MPALQRFDSGKRRSGATNWLVFCVLLLTAFSTATHADGPIAAVNGTVRALVAFENDLIAGGDFTVAGNEPARYIARWDGTRWHALGDGTNAPVRALAAFQGRLFAGGDFTEAGGMPANHVAMWEGGSWSGLGTGTNGPVTALETLFGLFVYAGGTFTQAGNAEVSNIAEWFDGSWRSLGEGLSGTVEDMTMRNNILYVAGDVSAIDNPGAQNIISFSPTGWVKQHDFIVNSVVHAVDYANGVLVMGGKFSDVWLSTPGSSVARKVGTRWHTLGFGVSQDELLQPGEVFTMTEYAGGVAAGGNFNLADGFPANNVALFDGSVWTALGVGTNGTVLALTEWRDNLVAGGSFTTAGGLMATNIARWDGAGWRNDMTPVALEDLRVDAGREGVELSWRLPAVSLHALSGVSVERAPHAEGPFVRRSSELLPESRMSWRDTAVEPNRAYWYRLRLASLDGRASYAGAVRIETVDPSATVDLLSALDPGHGQPVQIRYRLGRAAEVRLEIFDPRGRTVRSIESGLLPPGEYVRTWDRYDAQGRPAARGVYFVHLGAGETRSSRRLVLLSR